jgi:hypothetical protein
MGGFRSHALIVAALAAGIACSSPARAQCRLCDTPTTALSSSPDADGIVLDVETRLDFDLLILAGQGQGAAVIRPDGSNSAEGAVAGISPRAMVGTATVHGTADRAVRVELPSRVDLYSVNGGRISMDEIVSDLPSLPRLDSAGNLTFRFGGRVRITGDSDGDYRGDLPITVEYQ